MYAPNVHFPTQSRTHSSGRTKLNAARELQYARLVPPPPVGYLKEQRKGKAEALDVAESCFRKNDLVASLKLAEITDSGGKRLGNKRALERLVARAPPVRVQPRGHGSAGVQ